MRMICLVLCGAFTLAGGEVWLRDGARLPGEIKLADGAVEVDGSVLRVSGLKLAPSGAQVDVPAACKFVVPAKNLSTIRSLSE